MALTDRLEQSELLDAVFGITSDQLDVFGPVLVTGVQTEDEQTHVVLRSHQTCMELADIHPNLKRPLILAHVVLEQALTDKIVAQRIQSDDSFTIVSLVMHKR